MKKVLSVLLAAAMVMGMSVSAFAAEYSVPATAGTKEANIVSDGSNVEWGKCIQVRGNKYVDEAIDTKDLELQEGDDLYFVIKWAEDRTGTPKHADFMPSNWTLKINNAEYVDDAEFVLVGEKLAAKVDELKEGYLYAKVTLADDFVAKDVTRENEDEVVEFWMYIVDDAGDESEKAKVHYSLAEYKVITLTKAKIKDVVEVETNVLYELADGLKSQIVVFDFDGVLVKVKMFEDEQYLVKPSNSFSWNKDLSKEYDTDVDVITFNTELDVREVIFESAKDNKQVVAVVDGALVPVENTEFVTKYEIIENVELTKGYVATIDANEGAYALIAADVEIEVEVEEEVEADKANPETGAADFVGAAVAMAVVSVAAAGALALKK